MASPSTPLPLAGLLSWRIGLIAATYAVATWAGLRLLSIPGSAAIIWPGAGLLLGGLLLVPRRGWLTASAAAWAAAALTQHVMGVRLSIAVPLSLVGVGEVLLASWLIVRWRPAAVQCRTTTDMLVLAAVGALCAVTAGAVGALLVVPLGLAGTPRHMWTMWASGHAVGIILFAPLCLTWRHPRGAQIDPPGPARTTEAVVAFGLLSGASALIFFDGMGGIHAPLLMSLPSHVLPFAVLVALRFGIRGAALGMVIMSVLAVAGTAAGGGPFRITHPDIGDRVLVSQWFAATLTLVSVLLALAMEQGRFQGFQTRLLNKALAEANGVLVHEIGERERAALSLRMLLDATPEGIVVVDQQGVIVEVNSALETMFGYTRGQLLGQASDILVHAPDRHTAQADRLRFAASEGQGVQVGAGPDLQAGRSDGSTFPAQVELSPYRLGDELRMIATVRDVSDQRAVERRMATSLREKEVLLREVHHRVKNNMAVMSSLFYLQRRYAKDPETVRVFEDSEARVRSMAMVHEVLYRSSDLSAVDFSRYLESLVAHLANVYRETVTDLRLERDIEPIRLSLDQAVPCGLLLNEVLTNAFKHAFVDGTPAVLRVHARARDGAVLIDIMDNGVGIPDHVPSAGRQTLGVRLMQALTEQLDGSLVTARQERGTRSSLVFPLVVSPASSAALADVGPA